MGERRKKTSGLGARKAMAERLNRSGFLLRADIKKIWLDEGLSPKTGIRDRLTGLHKFFGQAVWPYYGLRQRIYLNPNLSPEERDDAIRQARQRLGPAGSKRRP